MYNLDEGYYYCSNGVSNLPTTSWYYVEVRAWYSEKLIKAVHLAGTTRTYRNFYTNGAWQGWNEYTIKDELKNLLTTKVFSENVQMNGVSQGGTIDISLSGYTPIAVAGWENGSNTATFIQRCEIINGSLAYTVRTTSNTSSTVTVYFDVTILYMKIA